MTLLRAITKLHASNMEAITIIRNDTIVYYGTIRFLLNHRKDLHNIKIDSDITYKVNKGYYCEVL